MREGKILNKTLNLEEKNEILKWDLETQMTFWKLELLVLFCTKSVHFYNDLANAMKLSWSIGLFLFNVVVYISLGGLLIVYFMLLFIFPLGAGPWIS